MVVAEVAEEAADVAADIYSPFASQERRKSSINQSVAKVRCTLERYNMQPAFKGHFKGVTKDKCTLENYNMQPAFKGRFKGVTKVKCTLEWYFIVGI